VQSAWDAFNATVKRAVDGAAENLSLDVPVALEDRTLRLSKAGECWRPDPVRRHADALAAFLDVSLLRLDQTLKQSVESARPCSEAAVRGGLAPAARTSSWANLRREATAETAVQGNRKSSCAPAICKARPSYGARSGQDYNKLLAASISDAAQGKTQVALPHGRAAIQEPGFGLRKGEKESFSKRFAAWFKGGGVTLYPLFAVGILALLMIAERLIYFARKNTNARAFTERFLQLAESRRWQEARELCAKSGSALARNLGALAAQGEPLARFRREGSARSMLREVPAPGEALPLIAAMGAAARCWACWGTVSGLVTLFKVLKPTGRQTIPRCSRRHFRSPDQHGNGPGHRHPRAAAARFPEREASTP